MVETKIAVVTGANKGLGYEMVKGLCEKYTGPVYLTSREESRGLEACEELKKLGYNATFHQLDITNKESILNFIEHIKNKNFKVDILINNAGILFLKDATESKLEQAEITLNVNFFSVVNITEAMLHYFGNGAKIVNISSSSGHLSRIPSEELRKTISSEQLHLEELHILMSRYIDAVRENKEVVEGWGDSPYVVSKVGLNAYTFLLHRRLKEKGIKVNCVHPGYIKTDMTRGAGTISASAGAHIPVQLALEDSTGVGGRYIWHDGTEVPWDGVDPRAYIDVKNL